MALYNRAFPFLFGGTFIEGYYVNCTDFALWNFPSFSEGLSLRVIGVFGCGKAAPAFPFLFGGTFIEGQVAKDTQPEEF